MKKRGCFKRVLQLTGALALLATLLVWGLWLYPFWGVPLNSQRHGNPPLTPAWALECWVWEDDTNTAASTLEMIDGYLEHDFPVKTILIDSPWSTRYNDFQVDETRFPDPEAFFRGLEERDIRVVLWMTSMVNSQSKDTAIAESSDWFQEAAEKGYIAGGSFQKKWWKGRGGFIDYTNPEAREWWHGMQQTVLDWGVDGWKLDGTATLAFDTVGPLPWFFLVTRDGRISTRAYMDLYYRSEYENGLAHNPEFVTLSRALDSVMPMVHPEGFAPIDASPVNWLGDNTHTWADETRGLERAIRLTLESAEMGYNIVGSDIAGYHGEEPIEPELYIRWAQFSTFTGLFLNGGHGERRMWKRTPNELEIIREFSWLHHALVPYMYHYVVTAHEGGRRLMQPVRTAPYHYLFGEELLVAPIHAPGNTHTVALPEGRWRYWFDDATLIEGPATITRDFPLDQYPVYVRDGAIIPMNIERAYTGLGEAAWAKYLTFNIYPGAGGEFTCFERGSRQPVRITTAGDPLTIAVDGATQPYLLRVFLETAPGDVTFQGSAIDAASWDFDRGKRRLIIRNDSGEPGTYTIR